MNAFIWTLIFIGAFSIFLWAVYCVKLHVSFNKKPSLKGEKIKLKDFSLFFVERGDPCHEKVLLLVHGFQSSHYFFHKNLEVLSEKMRVIALDLPGCGFSDKPLDFFYQFETLAGAVKEFLDARQIKEVIFAGHSMGGGVGLAFAALYPEKTQKLILIDPANPYDLESLMPFEKMTRQPGFFILTLMDQLLLSKKVYENKICEKQKISLSEIRKITAHKWTQNCRKAARQIVAQGGIAGMFRLREKIARIQCPVLLIYGGKDRIVNPEKAEDLMAHLQYSRLIRFEDCGHSPHYEQPEKFNQTVIQWVH